MKHLPVVLTLLIITTVGVLLPIEPIKANEPFVTDCYHKVNGVLDLYPYASFQGQGTCPPPTIDPYHLSDDPTDPPHLCQVVPVIEQ